MKWRNWSKCSVGLLAVVSVACGGSADGEETEQSQDELVIQPASGMAGLELKKPSYYIGAAANKEARFDVAGKVPKIGDRYDVAPGTFQFTTTFPYGDGPSSKMPLTLQVGKVTTVRPSAIFVRWNREINFGKQLAYIDVQNMDYAPFLSRFRLGSSDYLTATSGAFSYLMPGKFEVRPPFEMKRTVTLAENQRHVVELPTARVRMRYDVANPAYPNTACPTTLAKFAVRENNWFAVRETKQLSRADMNASRYVSLVAPASKELGEAPQLVLESCGTSRSFSLTEQTDVTIATSRVEVDPMSVTPMGGGAPILANGTYAVVPGSDPEGPYVIQAPTGTAVDLFPGTYQIVVRAHYQGQTYRSVHPITLP
ncbi:MAG: hypothetical protein U0174_24925 [Polyangiaceae bacterium]